MKKCSPDLKIAGLLILLVSSINLFSQVEGINYQAIARDVNGNPIENTTISVYFSIYNASSQLAWKEVWDLKTNEFGLFSVTICKYTTHRTDGYESDPIDIDWGSSQHKLKVEIEYQGKLTSLGTSDLMTVPYAQYANDSPDADPMNELQALELDGNYLSLSNNSAAIPVDLAAFNESNIGWTKQGDNVVYVNGNVGVGTSNPSGGLTIQAINEETEEPLFMVTRKDGYPVFAVYEDGVYAYTDTVSGAKGVKGGFAIGGYYSGVKGINQEIMRVTADSIRFYINQDTINKGTKSGFAIGGYYSGVKGFNEEYFNISSQKAVSKIPGENRVVWYPQRNAFLVGNVLVESPDSVGENSIATGYQSMPIGNFSEAFGFQSIARGDYSTAMGKNATAHAENSVSIGNHSRADKYSSFALGTGAIAYGVNSYAIGSSGIDSAGFPTGNTMSIGEQSFAMGMGSRSEGFGSFAIGTKNIASGNYSIAMGARTEASEWYSTAMGLDSKASGWFSTAFGLKSIASGECSTAMGLASVASGVYDVAIGTAVSASGGHCTALGRKSVASGYASAAIGDYNEASGNYSMALGDSSIANTYNAIAFGYRTLASGTFAMALGTKTIASGHHSTAMGHLSIAGGESSFAAGASAQALGSYVVALGTATIASGEHSTAMGYTTEASGFMSTSMGSNTKAIGAYSLAMGDSTSAMDWFATSMGFKTIAKGNTSTAMGSNTVSRGNCSTSMGRNTISRAYNSVAMGSFNDTVPGSSLYGWEEADPLFIIGNGVSEGSRHNALMVKKNGEIYFPDVFSDPVGASNLDLYIDNTGKIGFLSSSIRYKKNVESIEDISWLYNLRPVTFIYKTDEKESTQYGLIAEEVAAINPSFVCYNEKGEAETVAYGNLVSPIIKALKEQERKNYEQQLELEKKDKEIKELQDRLLKIESFISSRNF